MFFCFFGSCRFTNEQQNVEFSTNENLSLQWPVFANQLPNKHVQKNLCAHKQANEHMCICSPKLFFARILALFPPEKFELHANSHKCVQLSAIACNCTPSTNCAQSSWISSKNSSDDVHTERLTNGEPSSAGNHTIWKTISCFCAWPPEILSHF